MVVKPAGQTGILPDACERTELKAASASTPLVRLFRRAFGKAIQCGDNLIDLIFEEDRQGGFARSHQLGSMAAH
jgi:hypothetical protein